MSINKSVPIVCFAFAILTVLPNVAEAQLIDPNNRCYYRPGSTVCQPLPAPAPAQQPPRQVANQCESDCDMQQKECMRTCPQQHDWYRCFGTICGDIHTNCMRRCPM